jgi:signal transduction histidine kinase
MKDKIGQFTFAKHPVDNNFLILIPWLATLITGLSALEGLFLKDTLYVISCTIATLIFIGSYVLLVKGKNLRITAWIMVYNTLALSNIVWFRFEGSKGTAPIMVLLLLFCISLFFNKLERLLAIVLILVNLVLLFYIEYHYPLLIKPYPDPITRMADLFFTYSVCGIFIAFVVQVLIRSYMNEKTKAEQVDKLKSAFLANISHEVRTPMNAIMGFSNLIAQAHTKMKDRRIYSKFVFDACKSLTHLVDEIIDIAKIESNEISLQKARCNVTEIMDSVFQHFNDALEKQNDSNINFSMKPSTLDQDIIIETDPLLLKQVLINLIDNAIKFTQRGFVEYGYEVRRSELLFYVKDSGIGIPEEEREKIFRNFSKVEHNKERFYQGVGLGLALNKKILELLSGKIWLESEVGKGSTFWFTIPSNKIEALPRMLQVRNNFSTAWQKGSPSSVSGTGDHVVADPKA